MAADFASPLRATVLATALILSGLSAVLAQEQIPHELEMIDVALSKGLKFQHFSPFTAERHLHLTMGSGVGWIDVDRDGWPDVCFGQGAAWNGNPEPQPAGEESLDRIFRNRHGEFTDVTKECGLINHLYSMGLAVSDFDNDGFSDLCVSCFGPPRLYKNNGDGTFADVSSELSGDPWVVSASCTWFDANLDGLLDLYITNYLQIDKQHYTVCTQSYRDKVVQIPCPPRKYNWPMDTLFRNLGDGRFVDASTEAGLASQPRSAGLGVITNDLDDDHIPDLYVANDTTANFLLIGDGTGQFSDKALIGGVAFNRMGEAEAGMGVTSGDVDGDGRLDILVGNYYGESNTLYRNEGQGLFLDVTSEFGLAAPSRTRLAFGTLLCDLNNDSWLDLFVANGHIADRLSEAGMQIPFRQQCQLFINDYGQRFKEVSLNSGPYFHKEVLGRGCATADFDHDGDLDIVVQHLNDQAALLQNGSKMQGRSLSMELIGRNGNRDAIGATLEVQLPDRAIVLQRDGSSSYLSCNDGRLIVGVGQHDQPTSVQFSWPCGTTTSTYGVRPGRRISIVEGLAPSTENRVVEIPEMTVERNHFYRYSPLLVIGAATLAVMVALWMLRQPQEQPRPKSRSMKSDPAQQSEDASPLSLAQRAADQGEYETALQHIDHAIENQPDSIPANLLKAELLFRLYRTDEMRPALDTILRQNPEHFEAHANLAFALRYSGELDESEKHIEWCLLRRPDFLPILRMRAEILRDRGDSNRALTEIHDIQKKYPEDIETRILQAEILLYQRDFQAAYSSLQHVSDAARRNHRLAALMAQTCQLLGKEAEAKTFRDILNEQKRME